MLHIRDRVLFKNLYRYGTNVNTHDLLKAIAIILMLVDHLGLYLLGNDLWLRTLGRGAAPLFFFLVGHNAHHRFKSEIFTYGLILTALTFFLEKVLFIDILINFVLINWVLDHFAIHKLSNKMLLGIFVLLLILHLFTNLWLEYGAFGLLFAFAGRLSAEGRGLYWLLGAFLSYFLFECVDFHFVNHTNYISLFATLCLVIGTILHGYQERIWKLDTVLRLPILVISRYSLQIYFAHLVVFKIMA